WAPCWAASSSTSPGATPGPSAAPPSSTWRRWPCSPWPVRRTARSPRPSPPPRAAPRDRRCEAAKMRPTEPTGLARGGQPGHRATTRDPRRGGAMRLAATWRPLAMVALAVLVAAPVLAQEPPVRIGYAIARTGPWAAGAQVTQEPNYILWAEQVNAAGGLDVQGKRRKVELVGYDDRSETETPGRSYEKPMGTDHVDLVLPPWGTGANFAVLPLVQKYGYPILAPTATGRKLLEMKNPYFFAMLQQPDLLMGALADLLAARGVKT